MDYIKLEAITDSENFWNDSYVISQYVNSILDSCNVTSPVGINIGAYDQNPQVQIDTIWNENYSTYTPYFRIILPKIKDFYVDPANKIWDIKLRKAFLKHEIAHVIFSEMETYKNHKKISTHDEFILNNALEDVRIEYKFGKKFHGANDNFFDVQKHFYEKTRKKIETAKISLEGLAFYFMYRSKKFAFSNTPATEFYEKFYQKYKNFLDLSAAELQDLILQIKSDFLNEKQEQAEQKPEPQAQNNSGDESAEEENENQKQSEKTSNADEDSNESNSDSDSSDGENDDEDSDTDSDESESATGKDFSNSLQDSMKDSIENEKKSMEEKLQNDESETPDSEVDMNDSGELAVMDMSPATHEEIESILAISNQMEDFLKLNSSTIKKYSSKIVDLSKYCSLVARKTQTKKGVDRFETYEQIVAKNRKNISLLVNHFKLKFQQKRRNRVTLNREEGLINNQALYKMFDSSFDQKIFYNIEKSIVSKSDVTFLLDFSGSMSGNKIKNLLKSLIVLNEVFSKLEINFNVFSFNGMGKTSWKFDSKPEQVEILKAFSKYKNYKPTIKENEGYIYFTDTSSSFIHGSEMFGLIGRNTKSNERKNILKLLLKSSSQKNVNTSFFKNWRNIIFGGSTPEIQAVCGIYTQLEKQKLFIINDGQYDGVNLLSNESHDALNILNRNVSNYKISKIILKFLTDKKLNFKSIKDFNFFTQNLIASIPYYFKYNSMKDYAEILFGIEGYKWRSTYVSPLLNILDKLIREAQVIKTEAYFKEGDYAIDIKINKNEEVSMKFIETADFNSLLFKKNNIVTPDGKKLVYSADSISNVADLWRVICYENYYSKKLLDACQDIKPNNNSNTYKSLIQTMRNSGWDIWGIGIESNYGQDYLGKEFFTSVYNSKDITENLNKKVREIV